MELSPSSESAKAARREGQSGEGDKMMHFGGSEIGKCSRWAIGAIKDGLLDKGGVRLPYGR